MPVTVQSYTHILALTWSFRQFCEAGRVSMPMARRGNEYSEATGLAVGRGSVHTRVPGPRGGRFNSHT